MPLDPLDAARLWDMLTYADEVVQTAGQVSFVTYVGDKNLRLATERRIEIIGEAARNVSREFQDILRFPGARSRRNGTCWHTNTAKSSTKSSTVW